MTNNIYEFPELSVTDLTDFLSGKAVEHKVIGIDRTFVGVAQINRCEGQHLVWAKRWGEEVIEAQSKTIILPLSEEDNFHKVPDKTFILVENARDTFRLIVSGIFSEQCKGALGLDELHMFKQVGSACFVSPTASVSDKVTMGHNVIIHPNVVIYPNVKIGNNVEICAGSIVGGPGFGHVRQADGTLKAFPHIGGVQIGDDVTIGSGTCVDGGGLSPTLIGRGCKIGNLTQIAHNVIIGKESLIGTRCQIAGGTKIGAGTKIWAGVTIANNLTIGEDCDIKIGSIVITNLESAETVSGNFAVPHRERIKKFFEEHDNSSKSKV